MSPSATTCGWRNQSKALTPSRLTSGPGASKAATQQMLQRANNQVPTDTPTDNTCHSGEQSPPWEIHRLLCLHPRAVVHTGWPQHHLGDYCSTLAGPARKSKYLCKHWKTWGKHSSTATQAQGHHSWHVHPGARYKGHKKGKKMLSSIWRASPLQFIQ